METGCHISCAPRFKFVETAHRNINNNFLFLRHGSFHAQRCCWEPRRVYDQRELGHRMRLDNKKFQSIYPRHLITCCFHRNILRPAAIN